MKSNQKSLMALFYLLGALFLAGVFPVIPAVMLYVSRRLMGRGLYVVACCLVTLLLTAVTRNASDPQVFGFFGMLDPSLLVVNFLGIAMLGGAYAELEEQGSIVPAILTSGAMASLGTVGALSVLSYVRGPGWYADIHQKTTEYISQVAAMTRLDLTVTADDLLLQSPSIMVIFYLVSLFLMALMRSRVAKLSGETISSQNQFRLSEFRLPDTTIWFFIGSLLLAFFQGEKEWVSVLGYNVLNVTLMLYFLQGLGVISKFFEVQKVGQGWRILWMTIFVLQLFLVVSFLGVVDYWTDFRSRLVKKATL